MITLLCRQSTVLYYEAWEAGTTWPGDTIHKFQVAFEFTFVTLFVYWALILVWHFCCNEPQADLQGKPNVHGISTNWIFVFISIPHSCLFCSSKVKIIIKATH